jgi:uncharacterized membrane protein YvlD (DUF360 family)
MYDGFGKEWLASTIAFLVIFGTLKLGEGFWGGLGIVTLAIVLGWLSAASLMLLEKFSLPVNYLTVILVMLAANSVTLLIAAALTPITFGGFWHVIGWSLAIAVIRSFVRKGIDFLSGN